MAGAVITTPEARSPAGGGREPETKAAVMEAAAVEKESVRAAAEEVAMQFRTLVNVEDVGSVKQQQDLILGRLQDSNAVLSHFNEYSEQCYADVSGDFPRNTRLLKSMKSDLDHIFTKLRSMKAKLRATYPNAFPDASTTEIQDQRPDLERPLV